MPQDPNLYGQRPVKKQKKEIPLSSSLNFTSQLSSLISTPSSSSTPSTSISGRPRPSKNKDSIFSSIKAKRKASSSKPSADDKEEEEDGDDDRERDRERDPKKLRLKHTHNTEDEKAEFARARRKMEEKARLYAAMKRGDYIVKENEAAPLVDFDRKWAEAHPEGEDYNYSSTSSDGDNDEDNDNQDGNKGAEMIEYTDEFGRTRTGTRAEIHRLQRREARGKLGAAELAEMAAVPTTRPTNLIYGDAIQTEAFQPEAATVEAMAALAAKRDREPTPPPELHFDGRAEIRTKGTGFYQFSKEEETRKKEMEALERERENTERVRRERGEERERRRREIEERRRRIGERRAEKLAENFLDGLAGELGMTSAAPKSEAGKGKGEKESG